MSTAFVPTMPAQVTALLAAAQATVQVAMQQSAVLTRVRAVLEQEQQHLRKTLTPRQQLYGALALTAMLSSTATLLCCRVAWHARHDDGRRRRRDVRGAAAAGTSNTNHTSKSNGYGCCACGSYCSCASTHDGVPTVAAAVHTAAATGTSTAAAAAAASTRPAAVTAALPTHTLSRATSSASSAAKANMVSDNNKDHKNKKDDAAAADGNALQLVNVYETDAYVQQYLEFHYTPSRVAYTYRMHLLVEAFDYPVRMAQKFRKFAPLPLWRRGRSGSVRGRGAAGSRNNSITDSNNSNSNNNNSSSVVGLRGLDIGCAAGAATLEMSRYFAGGVIGVDSSAALIRAACDAREKVRAHRAIVFAAPLQGELSEVREVTVPAERVVAERCRFYVADCLHMCDEGTQAQPHHDGVVHPCNGHDTSATQEEEQQQQRATTTTSPLHSAATPVAGDGAQWRVLPGDVFDGVLCSNVLDRVSAPARLLRSFARLVRPGGVLVVASPYSWHDDVTPREEWLGARYDTQRSEEVVKLLLADAFDLLAESDEPFLLRTHVRHYQLGVAHCTVWRRKGAEAATPPPSTTTTTTTKTASAASAAEVTSPSSS